MISCLLALVYGILYDIACVKWVHYSELRKPLQSALFSMLMATLSVVSIINFIHNTWAIPFYVIGYGLGSYIAVRYL